MKIAKIVSLLLTFVLTVSLAACAGASGSAPGTAGAADAASASVSAAVDTSSAPASVSSVSGADETNDMATLYIGYSEYAGEATAYSESFNTYEVELNGEMTPEKLIAGIAELTGWDLTLADDVTSGKGGMTVCFSGECSLFVGPPEPQVEAFFVFDAESLCKQILDSIKKTLQMNYTTSDGDPDTLDIYYCMADDQPLTLDALGITWALDEPYQWKAPNMN